LLHLRHRPAVTTTRPGGRTARTRDAVFAAALDELGEAGYSDTSVESIAARAGVHKTTVYRRWGTKDALLAEVLAQAAEDRIDVSDSGDVDRDMEELARAVVATLTSPAGGATVRAIVAAAPSSPELGAVLSKFWVARRERVGPIIEAAIARGQLPTGTDPAALMRFVAAPLYFQLLMTDEPLTEVDARRAAASALAAARAGVLGVS
jgi:AcrR family transcriptional regulator